MSTDVSVEQLLRMLVALEETIIRLEGENGGGATDTTRRLRVVRGEILAALRLLEGDSDALEG